MRCRIGDLALVIAEDPGCEVNIGAFLTVKAPPPYAPPGHWGFEKATRPLKMICRDDGVVDWVTDSDGHPTMFFMMADRYLLPIRRGMKVVDLATGKPVKVPA